MNIPSRGFTKLDTGIVDSTLWMKDHDVLRVWIALLAKTDALGLVRASVPAMAHLCFLSVERFEEIIAELCDPDKHSRTLDHEGRRLRPIEGGWMILNYLKYRDMMQRKAMSHADRQKRYREKLKERDASVTTNVTRDTEGEGEGEEEGDVEALKESTLRVDVEIPISTKHPAPVAKIVELYHAKLPTLPKVEKLTKARAGHIQQRWREDLTTLEQWGNYFDYVSQSDFLMGRCAGRDGRRPFRATLEWLCRPANYANVAEEKYHG